MTRGSPRQAAVITGAGSGMGRACARRFAAEGWTVAAIDVDGGRLADLRAELGTSAIPLKADVRDAEAVDHALEAASSELGSLRCLVNAAGIYPPTTLETATQQVYRRIFDVNVWGIVAATGAVAPRFDLTGHCAIVNFASIDAFQPSGGQLLYAASKSAVMALTRSLALELAPRQICVNGVAPGWIDTEGNRATGRMDGAEATVPLGRLGSPDEVAELVWLLSGAGAMGYVTGETIVIGGGVVLR